MERTFRLALTAVSLGVLLAAFGCTTTRRITNTSATGLQQLLGTQAIDRAVQKLSWPDVQGKTVYVQTASPGELGDQAYLRQVVTAELAQRGAIVSDDASRAQYVMTVLAGALGTDEKDVFFGLPPVQSVLIPVALPEIAIYKSEEQQGFARTETVTTDQQRGGIVYRAGPTQGRTYAHTRKVLFIGWYNTDTTREQ